MSIAKKCNICKSPAQYKIKDNPDFYCADCAVENFGDLSYLQKIEEEAERLKEAIKKRMNHESH